MSVFKSLDHKPAIDYYRLTILFASLEEVVRHLWMNHHVPVITIAETPEKALAVTHQAAAQSYIKILQPGRIIVTDPSGAQLSLKRHLTESSLTLKITPGESASFAFGLEAGGSINGDSFSILSRSHDSYESALELKLNKDIKLPYAELTVAMINPLL